MADFEIIVTPEHCGLCPKHCDLKPMVKDASRARTGTLIQIKNAPEYAKITRTLNKNDADFEAGKRSQYEFDLTIAKCNRRLDALDRENAGMERGLSFTCKEPEAGDAHIDADVSVKMLVCGPSIPYAPTFATYANALKLLTVEQKARLRNREQWPVNYLEKFRRPKPNIEAITVEYIEKLRAADIDEFLFNEMEQTLKLFIEEPPRKYGEEFQTVINAITRLAREDARIETPTEEEKLAQEANKKLGPLIEHPGGE
jgi:hypothetical protein